MAKDVGEDVGEVGDMSQEELANALGSAQPRPRFRNCIVCDSSDFSDSGAIIVFEFPGYGVEIFTLPPERKSLWEVEAQRLYERGGVPRWLCAACHHEGKSDKPEEIAHKKIATSSVSKPNTKG